MANRIGGIVSVQQDGVIHNAKGNFSYNLGVPKRKSVMGSDGRRHGFTEEPQPGFIEGQITDRGDLDVAAMVSAENATVTLELSNGKTIVCRNADYAGEGTGNTDEGNIDFKFEGDCEEIPA